MWDSNAPLQLLKTMPKKLGKENLEKIQLIIDADKYKNSLISGFDLCGMYAPFCRGCKKTSIYPCAVSYINMLKSEGMDIDIDAKPVKETGVFMPRPYVDYGQSALDKVSVKGGAIPVVDEVAVSASLPYEMPDEKKPAAETVVKENVETVKKAVVDDAAVIDETDVEEIANNETVTTGTVTLQPPTSFPNKSEMPERNINQKIRIAVARKKI